jgi:hypothetical protein
MCPPRFRTGCPPRCPLGVLQGCPTGSPPRHPPGSSEGVLQGVLQGGHPPHFYLFIENFIHSGICTYACFWYHIFLLRLHKKLIRAPDSSPGLLGQYPSSKFFHQNNICMSPAVVGSQYGRSYDCIAAESLIAQLVSPSIVIVHV